MFLLLMFLAMLAFLATHDAAADEMRRPRLDLFGDPLPDEAIARIGSGRLRHPSFMRMTLEFSADGKTLTSGGRGVRIWDAATGRLRQRFDVAKIFTLSFAFTAEGMLIASADLERGIVVLRVFDPINGKLRRHLELPEHATTNNVTLSRDGKWLAYSHWKDVRLHDTVNGREVVRLPAGRDIAFLPDGKSIAISDISDTVCVYEIAGGKCIRRLKHEGDRMVRIVPSPDGRYLASIPLNEEEKLGEISIWDLQTGKERYRLKSGGGAVLNAAFSPDGKYVAVGCQIQQLLLFDLATGKEVRRYPTDALYASIAFSADGKFLATASGIGTIRLWETATGRVLPASTDPLLDSIRELRFSSDGRRLLGHAGIHFAWEPSTGREMRRFPHVADRYQSAALSPDETLLATTGEDGTIRLRDAKTGREVRSLKGHEKRVWQTIFSPDGRSLISSGQEDNTIRVWDVAGGREIHKFSNTARMINLTTSPDGRLLAAASYRRGAGGYEVVVWDLAAGREKTRFVMLQNNFAHQLAFSPNSRLLAAVGGAIRINDPGEVQVWDVNGEKQRRSLIGHKSWVSSVAFSPDNRTLATGNQNGELFLWELASGRRRHSFIGHESTIQSLVFSPDSRLLAASSFESPAYVWDVFGALHDRRERLSQNELQSCWTALAGDDAASAFQAIRCLAAAPKQTISFFREHLKAVPAPDLKRVRQLVDMLDSSDFSTRQKAAEELEKQADAVAGLLRHILAKEKPSLELRQRLRQIVEGIDSKPEALRAVRAVEVLEWIAIPDAVSVLDELVKGAANARLTREAIAAKRRLRHKFAG